MGYFVVFIGCVCLITSIYAYIKGPLPLIGIISRKLALVDAIISTAVIMFGIWIIKYR